jgi:hypothetical protein
MLYTFLLAFDVHHSRRATAPQQDENIVERRCLLELGDFFPRCDVVCSDQRIMEALHRFFLGS